MIQQLLHISYFILQKLHKQVQRAMQKRTKLMQTDRTLTRTKLMQTDRTLTRILTIRRSRFLMQLISANGDSQCWNMSLYTQADQAILGISDFPSCTMPAES